MNEKVNNATPDPKKLKEVGIEAFKNGRIQKAIGNQLLLT